MFKSEKERKIGRSKKNCNHKGEHKKAQTVNGPIKDEKLLRVWNTAKSAIIQRFFNYVFFHAKSIFNFKQSIN